MIQIRAYRYAAETFWVATRIAAREAARSASPDVAQRPESFRPSARV